MSKITVFSDDIAGSIYFNEQTRVTYQSECSASNQVIPLQNISSTTFLWKYVSISELRWIAWVHVAKVY